MAVELVEREMKYEADDQFTVPDLAGVVGVAGESVGVCADSCGPEEVSADSVAVGSASDGSESSWHAVAPSRITAASSTAVA